MGELGKGREGGKGKEGRERREGKGGGRGENAYIAIRQRQDRRPDTQDARVQRIVVAALADEDLVLGGAVDGAHSALGGFGVALVMGWDSLVQCFSFLFLSLSLLARGGDG